MRRALFVVLLTLVAAPAVPQPPALAGFDAWVAKGIKDWRTPGMAVAVVKDSQVVFAQGFGVRELGKPQPVDARTLFAIGSTTKAMTAALVGMMVDEKKVEWDAPVTRSSRRASAGPAAGLDANTASAPASRGRRCRNKTLRSSKLQSTPSTARPGSRVPSKCSS